MSTFKYLIFTEEYDVYGTNDEAIARAQAEYQIVVDVEAGIVWAGDEDESDAPVREWKG